MKAPPCENAGHQLGWKMAFKGFFKIKTSQVEN